MKNLVLTTVAADICTGFGLCAAGCRRQCLQLELHRYGEISTS